MKSLKEIRKDLHKIPEASFQEYKTTQYIEEYVSKLPLVKIHKFPFTGLLVEYSQGKDDYQLFRADMDALPITEQTGVDFSSQNEGYMHACGHDIHMTVLIGLIQHVVKEKPNINTLFLFQPAEEGYGGAERVLSSGILDKFPIKEAFALHVHPDFPVGTIACKPGILFGIPQEFDVKFKGRSSHAVNPHRGKDAIASAALFCNNIYSTLAKSFAPAEKFICHLGKISGGNARNITAEQCTIEGTLRSFDKSVMNRLKEKVISIADASAKPFNTEAIVDFLITYDPVVNDIDLYNKMKHYLPDYITLKDIDATLTGEDFGFFTSKYKGLMFWLGVDDKDNDLHTPHFLPNEDAIDIGFNVFLSMLD
ncbi:MAG: amidohydrolase [Candidatus Cloacimonadia bacterium]|jgi:N-acetyldiaminopimelate deacetylase